MFKYTVKRNTCAFHITTKDNIASISKNGLLPMLGERSLRADETEKRLYFFRSMTELCVWIDSLYLGVDPYELEVLKFNVKGRRVTDNFIESFLRRGVTPDKLEYLRLYNKEKGFYLPVGEEARGSIIEWKPLSEYKSLSKKL